MHEGCRPASMHFIELAWGGRIRCVVVVVVVVGDGICCGAFFLFLYVWCPVCYSYGGIPVGAKASAFLSANSTSQTILH